MIRTNSQRAGGREYGCYLMRYAKKNNVLLVFAALFLFGVTAGTLLMRTAQTDTLDLLLRLVDGYITSRREQTVLQNFLTGFASSMAFVGVLFVCGFCAISQPVIALAPLFRGLGFGFSVAALYARYGARAALFVALFILPDMLASTIAILFCCRESLRLSGNFLSAAGKGPRGDAFYPLRVYLGRYAAASILCGLSAFFVAVLYFAFANYVVLG